MYCNYIIFVNLSLRKYYLNVLYQGCGLLCIVTYRCSEAQPSLLVKKTQKKMAELTNLIGCDISIISQQDVRYDGRLFSINTEESSIILQNVQCKGTEDRVLGDKRVLPNPQILPLVSFPGREIKDLYVHDKNEAVASKNIPEPSSSNLPTSSANTNNNTNNNTSTKGKSDNNKKIVSNTAIASQPVAVAKPVSATAVAKPVSATTVAKPVSATTVTASSTSSIHNDGSKRPERGTGDYLKNLRVKGKSSDDAAANSSVFDFQAGLNAFNKEDVLNKLDKSEEKPVVNKYVKDDFFDSLSCDILDQEAGRKTRLNGYEERNLNKDTFGATAVQSNYYGRGGRGGRFGGRGGRFGGRGGRFVSGRGGRGRATDDK